MQAMSSFCVLPCFGRMSVIGHWSPQSLLPRWGHTEHTCPNSSLSTLSPGGVCSPDGPLLPKGVVHLLHTAGLLKGKNEPLSQQWTQVDSLPQQGDGTHRNQHQNSIQSGGHGKMALHASQRFTTMTRDWVSGRDSTCAN